LRIADFRSPKRRPFDSLFGRLYTLVKTGFILITNWKFDSYRIPQYCCDFMEVQPK